MKTWHNFTLVGALLLAASCGESHQSDAHASETESILDTTRHNTPADTSAVYDVRAGGTLQTAPPSQYQESTGNQASRVSIGTDTTGRRPHDYAPGKPAQSVPATGHDASGHADTRKAAQPTLREGH